MCLNVSIEVIFFIQNSPFKTVFQYIEVVVVVVVVVVGKQNEGGFLEQHGDGTLDDEYEEGNSSSSMSKSSENVGTFLYSSPEGCRNQKWDIYSLGMNEFISFCVSFALSIQQILSIIDRDHPLRVVL
jgi:hypothetical protein